MAATEKTKEILESIDRLVAEEQNKERLAEIQVSLKVQWIKSQSMFPQEKAKGILIESPDFYHYMSVCVCAMQFIV